MLIPEYSKNLETLHQQRQYDELLALVQPKLELDKNNGEALYWIICSLYETDKRDYAIKISIEGISHVKNKTWRGKLFNRIGSF